MEQPTTLIRNPTFQKVDETFAEYYYGYATFLFLRNLIQDINQTLSDPSDLEMFTNGATASAYMWSRARVDTLLPDPLCPNKFNHSHILTTCSSYLSSDDSSVASIFNKVDKTDLDSVVPLLKLKQMHKSLSFSNHNGLRRPPTSQRRPRPPTSAKAYQIDIQDPFASVDCPSDMDDHEVLAVKYYESALNAVTADPVKFSSQTTPCAACGEISHPFRDCKIHRNVEYLRTHHI